MRVSIGLSLFATLRFLLDLLCTSLAAGEDISCVEYQLDDGTWRDFRLASHCLLALATVSHSPWNFASVISSLGHFSNTDFASSSSRSFLTIFSAHRLPSISSTISNSSACVCVTLGS